MCVCGCLELEPKEERWGVFKANFLLRNMADLTINDVPKKNKKGKRVA